MNKIVQRVLYWFFPRRCVLCGDVVAIDDDLCDLCRVNPRIGSAPCDKCGKDHVELRFSNNPIAPISICFDCIKTQLSPLNLDHADLFCRAFNLPLDAILWIKIADEYKQETFKEYTKTRLEDESMKPNLYYSNSTHDLWLKANKE